MEVRLRLDFYGTKIPKVSSDNLSVTVLYDYKGPAQTLDIEVNTGKRGLWGDYDQESPAYHYAREVYASDILKRYGLLAKIPLSFWGDRVIDDCAVEVVIRGEGVYADAVLWDAYTVRPPAPPPVYTCPYCGAEFASEAELNYHISTVHPPVVKWTLSAAATSGGYVSPPVVTVNEGEIATITAYPYSGYVFDHWIREGLISYSNPYMAIMYRNISITAYFRRT